MEIWAELSWAELPRLAPTDTGTHQMVRGPAGRDRQTRKCRGFVVRLNVTGTRCYRKMHRGSSRLHRTERMKLLWNKGCLSALFYAAEPKKKKKKMANGPSAHASNENKSNFKTMICKRSRYWRPGETGTAHGWWNWAETLQISSRWNTKRVLVCIIWNCVKLVEDQTNCDTMSSTACRLTQEVIWKCDYFFFFWLFFFLNSMRENVSKAANNRLCISCII